MDIDQQLQYIVESMDQRDAQEAFSAWIECVPKLAEWFGRRHFEAEGLALFSTGLASADAKLQAQRIEAFVCRVDAAIWEALEDDWGDWDCIREQVAEFCDYHSTRAERDAILAPGSLADLVDRLEKLAEEVDEPGDRERIAQSAKRFRGIL